MVVEYGRYGTRLRGIDKTDVLFDPYSLRRCKQDFDAIVRGKEKKGYTIEMRYVRPGFDGLTDPDHGQTQILTQPQRKPTHSRIVGW